MRLTEGVLVNEHIAVAIKRASNVRAEYSFRLASRATSLPEGGFGANRFFSLSNFSLKHTDKSEFEGLVRVQKGRRPKGFPENELANF